MHEIFVTVMGRVASRPKSALTKSGHAVASFRLASTPRRYDRSRGSWVDGTTTWFTVTCWRGLADHVTSSVGVGDPLIVHGRLHSNEFTREDGSQRWTASATPRRRTWPGRSPTMRSRRRGRVVPSMRVPGRRIRCGPPDRGRRDRSAPLGLGHG